MLQQKSQHNCLVMLEAIVEVPSYAHDMAEVKIVNQPQFTSNACD